MPAANKKVKKPKPLKVLYNDEMIYPNPENKNETPLGAVRRDILSLGESSTAYFPLDFCLNNSVIDSVAKKYERSFDEYDDLAKDEEHYLLSFESCKHAKKLDCPYMKKAMERITDDKRVKDIFAIYLLELDESEDNRQNFIAMGKDKLYILYNAGKISIYDYDKIKFTEDGILEADDVGDAFSEILSYSFDIDFIEFAKEFMLLRGVKTTDVQARHPYGGYVYSDMVKEFLPEANLSADENKPIEKKLAYMEMLVNAAAAEGALEAKSMIKLAYLAKEFNLSGDKMLSLINKAYIGQMKKEKLLDKLSRAVTLIGGAEYINAFYQDLLEMSTDKDGESIRDELVKILKKEQFAGEKFVNRYMDYIKKRKAADTALAKAFAASKRKELYLASAIRREDYNDRLNLQIAAKGAMINEQ